MALRRQSLCGVIFAPAGAGQRLTPRPSTTAHPTSTQRPVRGTPLKLNVPAKLSSPRKTGHVSAAFSYPPSCSRHPCQQIADIRTPPPYLGSSVRSQAEINVEWLATGQRTFTAAARISISAALASLNTWAVPQILSALLDRVTLGPGLCNLLGTAGFSWTGGARLPHSSRSACTSNLGTTATRMACRFGGWMLRIAGSRSLAATNLAVAVSQPTSAARRSWTWSHVYASTLLSRYHCALGDASTTGL